MTTSDRPQVTVIGIGADGWSGLGESMRARITEAPAVVGAARHLALLPDVPGQQRTAWSSPFSVDAVPPGAVVLASGDPLLSGVATTLIDRVGPDAVEVLPHVSSVALARARLGWSAEETTVVTVVGRRPDSVLRQLAPGHRVLVLSSDETTPAELTRLLVDHGYGDSRVTVLGYLGSDAETRTDGTAAGWQHGSPRLNVVALDLVGPVVGSWATGLPDEAFEHDGQLTKRDLRASALARLAPQPGQLLWDVGAGAGSVGIEWLRAHPTCRAVAFERDAARARRIERNAASLGVPGLRVVEGTAPGALSAEDDAPHAIFIGGGATAPGLIDLCRNVLLPGGRLVAHGVTFETEQLLIDAHGAHGGELTRISVERATPVGRFTGWTPARAITQWAWTS